MRYYAELKDLIRSALEHGPNSFTSLCHIVQGAAPEVIYQMLTELGAVGNLLSEASTHREPLHAVAQTPEPHPVDFDWRFTEASAYAISTVIPQGGQVL
jgi:hypothetical protein